MFTKRLSQRTFHAIHYLAVILAILSIFSTPASAQSPEAVNQNADDLQPTLPEVVVSAEPIDESYPVFQQPVDMKSEGFYGFPVTRAISEGYAAGSTSTGTKIDVPLVDFPGSVETITRETMDDQHAADLFDVLRNVSGVYPGDGGGSLSDKIMLRGFEVSGTGSDFRKNGFRDASRTQRDTANVERIEFLKGPDSILYGSSEQPAGVVNYITKKPLDQFYRSARMRFGSWDDYRFTFDTTGPANDAGNLLYRMNMAVEDTDSFRDFVFKDRFFISPVIEYRLDAVTSLTIELEWLHDYRVPDRGIAYYEGSFEATPISRFLGEPTNRSRVDDGQIGIFMQRLVAPNIAWRVGYVSNWTEESRNIVEQKGDEVKGTEVDRRIKDDHTVDSNHYFIGDLTAELNTGELRHNIVLGTELGTTIRHQHSLEGKATKLDIFDPVYGETQPVPDKLRLTDIQDDQYSLYVQDLIALGPHLKGLAGVRWDSYQGKTYDTKIDGGFGETDESVLSPRFGVVLQPVPKVMSLYAGYSNSFAPQVGVTRLGDTLVPETGKMFETGIKFELLDGRLFMNFAGFDIFQQNLPVTDPTDTDYVIQVGEVESKGFEFDMVGQLTERLSIITNCAYIDARISKDTDASLLANRLPNVPYFGFSLWTRYNVVQNNNRTLGFATGVVYRGERQGDIDNSYQLPDYARWDAGIYYRQGRLQFSLLAENLLDTFYIASGKSQVANIPGAPFNLTGTVRVDF